MEASLFLREWRDIARSELDDHSSLHTMRSTEVHAEYSRQSNRYEDQSALSCENNKAVSTLV